MKMYAGPRTNKPVCRRVEKSTGKLASLTVDCYPLTMSSSPETPLTLETAVGELMLSIGHLVRRLRAATNEGELTLSQAATMGRLDRAGLATTADLARAESVKPQSMSATLTSLEEAGLVQRRPHPTDGRQVLFGLTGQGVEARRQRTVAKRAWLLAAMSKLDPTEQQTLISAAALIKRLGDS
jgi:DNA-binding MarR family transcriptional regulator